MTEQLFGIIPPMTTPFDAAGELDAAAVRAQVRWLLDAGVHGLAAGGSTGEGHALDQDELRRLVGTVAEEAAGRVPVIAGIIVDSTRDAICRGRAVADLGVAALQGTPVHYLFRPDEPPCSSIFASSRTPRGCRSSSTTWCRGAIFRRRCCAGSWPRSRG